MITIEAIGANLSNFVIRCEKCGQDLTQAVASCGAKAIEKHIRLKHKKARVIKKNLGCCAHAA